MATNALQFTWTAPPIILSHALDGYRNDVLQAIGELADYFAGKIESEAKSSAPWTDQTGAARQGLRAFAEKEATRIVLYLVHSVSYGIWLEIGTSRMSPRPVIMPVLERNHSEIMSRVRSLVGA